MRTVHQPNLMNRCFISRKQNNYVWNEKYGKPLKAPGRVPTLPDKRTAIKTIGYLLE